MNTKIIVFCAFYFLFTVSFATAQQVRLHRIPELFGPGKPQLFTLDVVAKNGGILHAQGYEYIFRPTSELIWYENGKETYIRTDPFYNYPYGRNILIKSLDMDSKGNIYIAGRTVYKFERATQVWSELPMPKEEFMEVHIVEHVFCDSKDRLWIVANNLHCSRIDTMGNTFHLKNYENVVYSWHNNRLDTVWKKTNGYAMVSKPTEDTRTGAVLWGTYFPPPVNSEKHKNVFGTNARILSFTDNGRDTIHPPVEIQNIFGG